MIQDGPQSRPKHHIFKVKHLRVNMLTFINKEWTENIRFHSAEEKIAEAKYAE